MSAAVDFDRAKGCGLPSSELKGFCLHLWHCSEAYAVSWAGVVKPSKDQLAIVNVRASGNAQTEYAGTQASASAQ